MPLVGFQINSHWTKPERDNRRYRETDIRLVNNENTGNYSNNFIKKLKILSFRHFDQYKQGWEISIVKFCMRTLGIDYICLHTVFHELYFIAQK